MKFLQQIRNFITSRLFVTSLLILVQITALVIPFILLGMHSVYIHAVLSLLSLVVAIALSGNAKHAPFHLIWIIILLAAPIAGWPIYLILRHNQNESRATKRCDAIASKLNAIPIGGHNPSDLSSCQKHPFRREMYLLHNAGHAPIYAQTATEYYPNGETFFPVYLEKLRSAEKFIFMEYFILNDGYFWQEIRRILLEKAEQGVEIRILHDDLATISSINGAFTRELRKRGIMIYPFNPYRAAVDSFMNYRDHRKITVIDGKIGFTGGINIADEYINAIERFGHWKDSALMLEGDAVASLTRAFLKLWNFAVEDKDDMQQYLISPSVASNGLVQPYCDSPTDDVRIGRDTYRTLISSANRYVWITAPYLIPEPSMLDELCMAASSGVDVRIITPHIPDKPYVHAVTRSNYELLIRAGVRVYEYTPGFIHAKTIVTDDACAMVATTNFDIRSFYSLFENGVLLYSTPTINRLKDDFLATFAESEEMTLETSKAKNLPSKIARDVCRIFAPFM